MPWSILASSLYGRKHIRPSRTSYACELDEVLPFTILAFPIVEKIAEAGQCLHQQIPFHRRQGLLLIEVLTNIGARRHMVGDDRTYAVLNFQDFGHVYRL